MHTTPDPEPGPAVEPAPCPWCQTPTVPDRPFHTRGLEVGGKTIGELCPRCTAESRALDGEARDYSPDPPSAW